MVDEDSFPQNLALLCSYEKSIAEICRKLGFNRQQFNKYLSGASFPSRRNLRRICDHFGVSNFELLLPHHEFSNIIVLRPRNRPTDAVLPEAHFIERIQAASRSVEEKYVGFYFIYSPSFSFPGYYARSLVRMYRREGVMHSTNIEYIRRQDLGEPTRAILKNRGIVTKFGERINVFQEEVLTGEYIGQVMLLPSSLPTIRYLPGIQLGYVDANRRIPAAARILLEFLGPKIDLRRALRSCGQISRDAIPPQIVDTLGGSETLSRSVLEATVQSRNNASWTCPENVESTN